MTVNKVKRKEMVESINDHERRIHRIERLFEKNGFGFDLPELPKTGDFFEIVQAHSDNDGLRSGDILEVAKVNHNTNHIKFVGGFNGYFTDFDRSVYLGGAEDEPMKPMTMRAADEPKLKQLDQSIFNGLDGQWRFAVMQHNGYVILCNQQPFLSFGGSSWDWNGQNIGAGGGYDATDWQNSLIERKELTGKALVEAMLDNCGRKKVLVRVSSSADTKFEDWILTFAKKEGSEIVTNNSNTWDYMAAVDIEGEPLTQSDAGL